MTTPAAAPGALTTPNAPTTPAAPKPDAGKLMPAQTSFQHSMEPRDFNEMKELAKILAGSDIVPKDLHGKPANVLLVLMFGREVGLSTAQALQNIMVVNGRPAMWGDAVIGKVESSGLLEWWKDTLDEKTMTASFAVKRVGRPDPVARTFSQADAQKAGLWSKAGPWTQYPKRMLFCRARAFALRDLFPDVLKGLRIVEEDRDIIEVTKAGDGTYAMPQRAAEPAPTEPFASTPEPRAEKQAAPSEQGAARSYIEAVGKDKKSGEYHVLIGGKDYACNEAMARAAKALKDAEKPVEFVASESGILTELQEAGPAD